jgi:hypothetical protein
MSVSGSSKSSSSHSSHSPHSAGHASSKSTHSTHSTHSTKSSKSTKSTKSTRSTKSVKATGANPKLAAAVKAINIHKYDAKKGVTYCNMAVNAYAKQLGYKGFQGLNANSMFSKMSKPNSGWHKASAAEAIAAAKAGKLTVAGWTGKVHGHVAAVIGEYSSGVPAIAQAGGHTKKGVNVNNTFEYGSIKQTRANPTYFVHD